jgi:hypothetical protein
MGKESMCRDPGIQNSQESGRGVAKDAYRVFACRANADHLAIASDAAAQS